MKTLNGHYRKIGFPSNVLTFPSKNSVQHSLYQNMKFLAIELSGRYYETQVFYQKMLTLLIHIKNWYELVFRRWAVYATSRNSDPYITDVNTILSFLHGIYLNGIYLFIYLFTYLFIYLFMDILSTTHYKCTVNFSGMPYIILKLGNLWLILIEVGRLFHNKLPRKISKFRS